MPDRCVSNRPPFASGNDQVHPPQERVAVERHSQRIARSVSHLRSDGAIARGLGKISVSPLTIGATPTDKRRESIR